jgi:hypothetical protein
MYVVIRSPHLFWNRRGTQDVPRIKPMGEIMRCSKLASYYLELIDVLRAVVPAMCLHCAAKRFLYLVQRILLLQPVERANPQGRGVIGYVQSYPCSMIHRFSFVFHGILSVWTANLVLPCRTICLKSGFSF